MSKQVPSKEGRSTNKQANQQQDRPARMTRQAVKYERRQEDKRRRQEEQRRAARRKMNTIIGIVAIVVLLLGGLGYFVYTNYVHPSVNVVPTVVPTFVNPNYPPVDGISCDTLEQSASHYHAHLSVYVNGQHVALAAQIGIAPDGSCFYWLHTHTNDGIIHIEAPPQHTFTLGNFLDIWGQKFINQNYASQLDQPGGPDWKIWVNGQPVDGDFHSIVLKSHLLITLAYNSPDVKPDTTFNWNGL